MKRLLFFSAMISAILLPAITQAADIEKNERTIMVNASATEEFEPDTAVIDLAVETSSKSAAIAANENAKRSDKVLTEIKKLIGEKDKIRTSSYSIQPVYEYDNVNKRNVLTGYKAFNHITVNTKKIKTVGEFVDTAIKNGANNVGGVRFTISDNSKCDIVMAKAAERAKRQALVAAKAFGVEIKGIKYISPSCGDSMPMQYKYLDKGIASSQSAASTPVEPGEVILRGNVSAVFFIGE